MYVDFDPEADFEPARQSLRGSSKDWGYKMNKSVKKASKKKEDLQEHLSCMCNAFTMSHSQRSTVSSPASRSRRTNLPNLHSPAPSLNLLHLYPHHPLLCLRLVQLALPAEAPEVRLLRDPKTHAVASLPAAVGFTGDEEAFVEGPRCSQFLRRRSRRRH